MGLAGLGSRTGSGVAASALVSRMKRSGECGGATGSINWRVPYETSVRSSATFKCVGRFGSGLELGLGMEMGLGLEEGIGGNRGVRDSKSDSWSRFRAGTVVAWSDLTAVVQPNPTHYHLGNGLAILLEGHLDVKRPYKQLHLRFKCHNKLESCGVEPASDWVFFN